MKLKKNERLVFAGNTAIRTPGGTPLPSVPQYIVVAFDEANPAAIAAVKNNERVVLIGRVMHEKPKAEERFAAAKEGRTLPPDEKTTPLYILMDAKDVNPKTGVPYETGKALRLAGKELAAFIAIQRRKNEALEKQGITETT